MFPRTRSSNLEETSRAPAGLTGRGRARLAAFLSLVCAVAFLQLYLPATAMAADEATTEGKSLFEALTESGPIGVVIVLCSIAGVSLAITFAFQVRRDVLVPPELLGQVEQLFEDEDYEEAFHVCEANPSFLSAVIASGLGKIDEGFEEMNESMLETGEIESTKLHQKVGYLSLIANVAPMLGLLGTVSGMITTFNTLATSDVQPKPAELAGGIGVALGTTFLGLLVAIPMTIVFVFFRNRVVNVVVEVGAIAEELMARFKGAA